MLHTASTCFVRWYIAVTWGRVTTPKTHPCHNAEQTHCRIFWRLSHCRNGGCHNAKRRVAILDWTGSYLAVGRPRLLRRKCVKFWIFTTCISINVFFHHPLSPSHPLQAIFHLNYSLFSEFVFYAFVFSHTMLLYVPKMYDCVIIGAQVEKCRELENFSG